MKKGIKSLIMGLAIVPCAFGLTACGEKPAGKTNTPEDTTPTITTAQAVTKTNTALTNLGDNFTLNLGYTAVRPAEDPDDTTATGEVQLKVAGGDYHFNDGEDDTYYFKNGKVLYEHETYEYDEESHESWIERKGFVGMQDLISFDTSKVDAADVLRVLNFIDDNATYTATIDEDGNVTISAEADVKKFVTYATGYITTNIDKPVKFFINAALTRFGVDATAEDLAAKLRTYVMGNEEEEIEGATIGDAIQVFADLAGVDKAVLVQVIASEIRGVFIPYNLAIDPYLEMPLATVVGMAEGFLGVNPLDAIDAGLEMTIPELAENITNYVQGMINAMFDNAHDYDDEDNAYMDAVIEEDDEDEEAAGFGLESIMGYIQSVTEAKVKVSFTTSADNKIKQVKVNMAAVMDSQNYTIEAVADFSAIGTTTVALPATVSLDAYQEYKFIDNFVADNDGYVTVTLSNDVQALVDANVAGQTGVLEFGYYDYEEDEMVTNATYDTATKTLKVKYEEPAEGFLAIQIVNIYQYNANGCEIELTVEFGTPAEVA